jgi:uncharacterized protein (DUF433 family)
LEELSMSQSYIEQHGGGYWIGDTRVSLDSVVYRWLEGLSPESIAECFPALNLEQVYGAITFYLSNRAEVDEYLREADKEYESFRQRIRAQYLRLGARLDDLLRPAAVKALLPIIGCLTAISVLLVSIVPGLSQAQQQSIPLDSINGLKLVNVKAEPVTFKGRQALRVTDTAAMGTGDEARLAILTGTEFQDGIIEVDLAGELAPGAAQSARGFVGIAFRVAPDGSRFECIYLRPTNGRAEDQVRRNHSVQYISVPAFPWQRLRKEFPEQYETYVDLVPGEWTRVKIEARADKARLYVNAAQQPTLLVNDLKQGQSQGRIALWVGPGTVAHFSNLRYQTSRTGR